MLKSKDLYVLKWERQQRFRPGSQDLFLVASTGELLKVPTKVSKISDSNAVFQAIFKQRRPLVIFPQLPGQLPLHVFESRCSWACVFFVLSLQCAWQNIGTGNKIEVEGWLLGAEDVGKVWNIHQHCCYCKAGGRTWQQWPTFTPLRQCWPPTSKRCSDPFWCVEMRRQPRFWDPLWKRHGLSFETKGLTYKSLWLSTSRSFRCYECKRKRWSKVLWQVNSSPDDFSLQAIFPCIHQHKAICFLIQ